MNLKMLMAALAVVCVFTVEAFAQDCSNGYCSLTIPRFAETVAPCEAVEAAPAPCEGVVAAEPVIPCAPVAIPQRVYVARRVAVGCDCGCSACRCNTGAARAVRRVVAAPLCIGASTAQGFARGVRRCANGSCAF